MTSSSIILAVLLFVTCLVVPKRSVSLPFIVAACLVPMNQRVFLGGLDFTVLRILVLAGMLRMLISGEEEEEPIKWHSFDKLVLAWSLSSTLIYTIQFGTIAAFVNRCGVMYDSLGIYWLFRHFFRTFEDITQAIKIFAICAIISTPLLAVERITHSSPFSIFGPTWGAFHHGRFRCAGSFPHYIILGSFWASMLPLFYSSWKAEINSTLSIVGVGAALCAVYFSASSTPVLTVGAMILFWMCYNYREAGKSIFLFVCGILVLLHLIMNNPVWHLIARVDVFGGSTGWHRFYLFDQFIKHTSEWFLIGTESTAHWGRGLRDVTNQYVLEAVRGGSITLVIFLCMLYRSVKISGKYSLIIAEKKQHWVAWGLCVALLGHTVAFWGVSYFGGQIVMLFNIQLAMVAFLAELTENA